MTHADRNPFILARKLGINAALWGPATRPRNYAQTCATLDAIRAEALQRATDLLVELEAMRDDDSADGRLAWDVTVGIAHDLMAVVCAVDSLKTH